MLHLHTAVEIWGRVYGLEWVKGFEKVKNNLAAYLCQKQAKTETHKGISESAWT